jgi:hypothetical protein
LNHVLPAYTSNIAGFTDVYQPTLFVGTRESLTFTQADLKLQSSQSLPLKYIFSLDY